MSKGLGHYLYTKRRQAQDYFESWQSTVYSMVVFGATMVVIFWASVFLYTSFYFTFMPQESITWPIHFHYKSCEDVPGLCSNPSAVIPVLDPKRGSLLVQGQKYRVVVDLEMPESPVNQRLGMFLMNMGMKNQGGETLRQASRSSMLRYKSSLLQVISTTVFAPLLLYGLQEEKQLVTVELFSQYEEDPVLPLSEVHIELASRHVELYSAQLRVHAMFSGLRYFMFHYPVSAGVVGVGICMVFLSTVVILSWYQFSAPTLSPVQAARPQNMASFPNGSAPSIATLDTTASNTKVEEEKRAAASVSEGELPDQEAAKGQSVKGSSNSSSSEMNNKLPLVEETIFFLEASRDSARAEKGDRDSPRAEKGDRDSPVAEKGDRDDFEMVVPSKVQGAFRRAGEEAGPSCEGEGDSVVRQRVQSVL